MRRASATQGFAASVRDAETLWYDTDRWPAWIDGMARVRKVAGDWPGAGATGTGQIPIFIRRATTSSLRAALLRFGAELAARVDS